MRLRHFYYPAVFLVFSFVFSSCSEMTKSAGPRVVLWAWEQPENLRFINVETTAVAFLAQSVELIGSEAKVSVRKQPLSFPEKTKLIAVTRIESTRNPDKKAALDEPQRAALLRLLIESANLKNVSAIQVDFDALVSERDFYVSLMKELRTQLPVEKGLSMTALASWCIGDRWIGSMPVDEAVPMLFDMGADDRNIRQFLASGDDWPEPKCRLSYGISLREKLGIKFRENRRFYLFKTSPGGWKESDFENLPDGVKL